MNLSQSLNAIEGGALVRRKAWHHGKLWVSLDTRKGFREPVIAQFARGETVEWPLHLGRGDWCADDWYIMDDAEIEAQRARAKPSQASPRRKSPLKRPKGASGSDDA